MRGQREWKEGESTVSSVKDVIKHEAIMGPNTGPERVKDTTG